jgi:rod shape-determining protein MreD
MSSLGTGEYSDPIMGARRRPRTWRFRNLLWIPVPLIAIVVQVYMPLFVGYLSFLELPLLLTVYFALTRREPIPGMLAGCAIGLAQDALSHNPIGMFGIVKSLVGYLAGSLSQRIDVDNFFVRFLAGFVFFFFHHFLYWALAAALLSEKLAMDPLQTLVMSGLNALVAVPLFAAFDKL